VNPRRLPVVGHVLEFGPEDRVFDPLLLLGPLLVALVVALGRSPLTEAFAAGNVAVFLGYVLYRGVAGDDEQ